MGHNLAVLTSVTWPSPVSEVVIQGWRYEPSVGPERVLEVAPDALVVESGMSPGTRRWVEHVLSRRAAVDTLMALGLPPDRVVVEESGAPRFADTQLGLSIAHCHGLVLAAAGPGGVGVDVEPADRDVSRLESALLPGEGDVSLSLGLLEIFVCKEAAAKATGLGLGGSMSRWPLLDIELFGDHPRATIGSPDGAFIAVRVWEHEGFVTALATVETT